MSNETIATLKAKLTNQGVNVDALTDEQILAIHNYKEGGSKGKSKQSKETEVSVDWTGYQGNPLIKIEGNFRPISFGYAKGKNVMDNLERCLENIDLQPFGMTKAKIEKMAEYADKVRECLAEMERMKKIAEEI